MNWHSVLNFIFHVYLIYLCSMNISAFILYKTDKEMAVKKKWRIKESTLLKLGLFGGSVGAFFAMGLFNHKINNNKFWITNIIGVIWQLILFCVLLKNL